jgi:hypothetical protein
VDAGGQQQGFCCEGNCSSTFEIRGRRPTRVGRSSSRRLLEGGFVRGRRKCKMGQDERGMGCSKMMARKRRLLLMIFSGCVTVRLRAAAAAAAAAAASAAAARFSC